MPVVNSNFDNNMLRNENPEIWKTQRNVKIVYRVSESLHKHRCENCKSTLSEEKNVGNRWERQEPFGKVYNIPPKLWS